MGHLRSLAGDIAGGDDPQHGQLGDQADTHGRGCGQVASERAGEEDLLNVAVFETCPLQEEGPSRGDGGLCELQLAHVALREVDAVLDRGQRRRSVQDEHPLLAQHRQPLAEVRLDGGGGLRGDEAPAVVQQADSDQLGHSVNQPGAA